MAVPFAVVFVSPGQLVSSKADEFIKRFQGGNQREARQLEGERGPPAVIGVARTGDLFATTEAPNGAATACAVGLPADVADPKLEKKVLENMAKVEVRCVPIPPGAEVVVVEVPPFPRLD